MVIFAGDFFIQFKSIRFYPICYFFEAIYIYLDWIHIHTYLSNQMTFMQFIAETLGQNELLSYLSYILFNFT